MSERRDVWSALANPVRRSILDQLRSGPCSTGELAEAFPDLSRFAVMQHLGVLEQTGLVLPRRRGRTRLNFLNPTPLEEIRTRWLHGFAQQTAQFDLALRDHLENDRKENSPIMPTTTGSARAVRVASELRFQASAERVFAALTGEQHRWYPYTYGGDRVRDIVFEERVGGLCFEDWGDGAGHWYGTITHFDPPRAYVLRGALGGGTTLEQRFELEADSADPTITVVRHSMVAFGELTDEEVEGIRSHGDLSLFEPQLKAWVEEHKGVR